MPEQELLLPELVDSCVNVHLDATEHEYESIVLHAVKEGPADRSYGLQVAALGEFPKPSSPRPKAGSRPWRRSHSGGGILKILLA